MDITKKELKLLHRSATESIESESEKYELEVEDRIYDKLAKILSATSREEAQSFAKRAWESNYLHCLVDGKRPRTAEWFDKQVVKARSLAKSLYVKDEEAAAKQESRAQRYEIEAKKLREPKK